jgi:putative acetyltransferase
MTLPLTKDITIRSEIAADIEAITELTRRAFHGKSFSAGDEQDLILALRDQGALAVSLVALQADEIVGHVAFSPAFAQDGAAGWFALGPISVEPTRQRQGIGGKLIHAGLERLVALQACGCVLIGDTNYYPRHGFVPRPDLAPVGEPAAHYMVLPLNRRPAEAIVAFHPAFHTVTTA